MWGAAGVTKSPAECRSKNDVRAELDRIDRALTALFGERHGYVRRITDFKTDPGEALDPDRIEAVIKKVRSHAEKNGMDMDQAEKIWRTLIDWNVNFEKEIISGKSRAESARRSEPAAIAGDGD